MIQPSQINMSPRMKHMLKEHGVVVAYVRDRGGWARRDGEDNLLDRKSGMAAMRRKSRRECNASRITTICTMADY